MPKQGTPNSGAIRSGHQTPDKPRSGGFSAGSLGLSSAGGLGTDAPLRSRSPGGVMSSLGRMTSTPPRLGSGGSSSVANAGSVRPASGSVSKNGGILGALKNNPSLLKDARHQDEDYSKTTIPSTIPHLCGKVDATDNPTNSEPAVATSKQSLEKSLKSVVDLQFSLRSTRSQTRKNSGTGGAAAAGQKKKTPSISIV